MLDAMEETIRSLQDQVNAALLASDWQRLTDLVAPQAHIIGPRGYSIDRDEWIGVHQSGEFEQGKLEVSQSEIAAYDRAGIRVDVVDSACTYKGEVITGRFRVLQVWATVDERWQLVALQYTSLTG
jgi:Domain of unknown function (DUF4440)